MSNKLRKQPVKSKRWTWVLCAALLGCGGYAMQASITGLTSTKATLNAVATCSGSSSSNPCTSWFQYWADGASAVTSTPHNTANVNTGGNVNMSATLTGLQPDTVYHYQFCGYGDDNIKQPGLCIGPLEAGGLTSVNAPGKMPDANNFSAVSTFRTAGTNTAGTVDLGRVVTSADTSTNPITRDSGFSVNYSGTKVLWLFDDTQQKPTGCISSVGSAAQGTVTPGAAPQTLVEFPTPPAAPPSSPPTSPAPFLRAPTGLVKTDGQPCGPPWPQGCGSAYAANWLNGAAKIPNSSNVLIVYGEHCICDVFLLERIALVEYNPTNNTLGTVYYPFVASPLKSGVSPIKNIGSPIFHGDGYVYFFVGVCDGWLCSTAGGVYVVRVGATAASWSKGANYRWWTGSTWSSDPSSAVSVVSGATPVGGSVHVADYSAVSSKKYVMLEQVGFGIMEFNMLYANSPTGPWKLGRKVKVPEAVCTGGPMDTCYAVKGHPEISTSSQLLYSWYSPADRAGYGHIRIGAMAW